MATRKQAKYEESLKRLEGLSKRYAEVQGARYQMQLAQQREAQAKIEAERRRAEKKAKEASRRRRTAQYIGGGIGLAAGITGTAITGDPKLIATGLQGGLAAGNLGGQIWNKEEIDPANAVALGSAAAMGGAGIQAFRQSESAPKMANAGYSGSYESAPQGTMPSPRASRYSVLEPNPYRNSSVNHAPDPSANLGDPRGYYQPNDMGPSYMDSNFVGPIWK